ncbi:conserved hypothetical protein [Hyella patelloides LEGE 07179]|uniref:Uncharacterized protein n=1 Tax=Hyella patelloides LEGE 07179 TaxID=945734 RepID=A0A563VNF4_9CYAN|nr:hypothetical protein [Hyella patelloides]VEP12897.1 conserved hypothetical protein [Hyella patelloides LEGE 07179]
MKNFKKLQPLTLRRECEPNYEKQIWQPNWCCFCCHDTGFVLDRLAAYVIEGYVGGQHKIVECRATRCQAEIGETLRASGSLDRRLTPEICDHLDCMEREEWARTAEKQHELRKRANGLVDELAQRKSIRLRRRTPTEEMEVRRKHEEVINQ